MQEEALARLREMQRRSRTAVNQPRPQQSHPSPPPLHEPDPPQHQHQHQHQPPQRQHVQNQPPHKQSGPPADFFKNLLGDTKIDSEKALILIMLYVLYKNKADMKLLLALGYLLI